MYINNKSVPPKNIYIQYNNFTQLYKFVVEWINKCYCEFLLYFCYNTSLRDGKKKLEKMSAVKVFLENIKI